MKKSTRLIFAGTVLLLCSALLLAYVVNNPLRRRYNSKTIIELKPDNYSIRVFTNSKTGINDPNFMVIQMGLLRSAAVLYPVIDQLGLVNKWSAGLPAKLTQAEVYERLFEMIEVREMRNTDMVEVSVYSADAQEAADIANAVAVEYQNRRKGDLDQMEKQDMAKLSDEVDKQRKKTAEARAEALRIRSRDNINDIDPESMENTDGLLQEYKAAKQKYIEEKRLLDAAEQRLKTEELELKISNKPVVIWERAEPAKQPAGLASSPPIIIAGGAGLLCAVAGGILLSMGLRLKGRED